MKEWERIKVAIWVGNLGMSRVWNRDDSHGCNAARKSIKAPGGEDGRSGRRVLMGD
jgi:hypothetical protein